MGRIVPLYAADQGLVDLLCDIIRAQESDRCGSETEDRYYMPLTFEDQQTQDLYNRVITP